MHNKQHWEDVYKHKQPDEVSWFQARPEISVDLIRRSGMTPSHALIDVGGGASHLVDSLLEAGYENISVLDIAACALVYAKRRLGQNAQKVTWLESDVTLFVSPKRYALWHDRAVFHFLTQAKDRKKYLEVMAQALLPDAYVVLATFALDGPERCSGLPVERYDSVKISKILGPSFGLLETRREEHLTPQGRAQHFEHFLFKYTA